MCLAIWALAGIAMGFYNLQRYATGSGAGAGYELLWQATPWQPPGGSALAVVVTAAGYIAVATLLALLRPVTRAGTPPGRLPGRPSAPPASPAAGSGPR